MWEGGEGRVGGNVGGRGGEGRVGGNVGGRGGEGREEWIVGVACGNDEWEGRMERGIWKTRGGGGWKRWVGSIASPCTIAILLYCPATSFSFSPL